MHAVTRFYTGPGATELFDALEAHKDDVAAKIRAVPGFVSYTLLRTEDGGVSVTVCKDAAGADASLAVARTWIAENLPKLKVNPPGVAQGSVILNLS